MYNGKKMEVTANGHGAGDRVASFLIRVFKFKF